MTVTAGDVVADDTGLPALDDLILKDPAADPLTSFADDRETILALCVKYAVAGSGAEVEARFLMATDHWSKRVSGLRGFLQMESAQRLRARLEASVDWTNALNGIGDLSRSLVKAETVFFDDLLAYIAALKVMEQIINRYTELRKDLDEQRREVVGNPDWPAAKYMGIDAGTIDLLEAELPDIIDPGYMADLTDAIAMATNKIGTLDRSGRESTAQPGQRRRPGRSRSAARERAANRDGRPTKSRDQSRGGQRRGRR